MLGCQGAKYHVVFESGTIEGLQPQLIGVLTSFVFTHSLGVGLPVLPPNARSLQLRERNPPRARIYDSTVFEVN